MLLERYQAVPQDVDAARLVSSTRDFGRAALCAKRVARSGRIAHQRLSKSSRPAEEVAHSPSLNPAIWVPKIVAVYQASVSWRIRPRRYSILPSCSVAILYGVPCAPTVPLELMSR